MKAIRNFNSKMQYRRFGKTEKKLSVITLGGMRYKKAMQKPREKVSTESLDHGAQMTRLALEHGINHIETAWGYGNSEYNYGKILNQVLKIPRDTYWLMTKGHPKKPQDVRPLIEEQLRGLQTDHIDLYAWHGINTEERFQYALETMEELLKLKEEGVLGNIGFSTHGQLPLICRAIETGLFDFVNLHYYYFFQRHHAAVQLAQARDMGVFIISPNDKGGQLWHPYPKLRALTKPLTPIQFNARFCLSTPAVHTLSFGMTEPSHFEEMQKIFPAHIPLSKEDLDILSRVDLARNADRFSHYEGYDMEDDPSGINIPEILRMRRMWKCYEMNEFLSYRYNMFAPADNWFRGEFATEDKLSQMDTSKIPEGIPLKELLAEVHEHFYTSKSS